MKPRFPWLWDTEMDNEAFESVLRGPDVNAHHDRHWAMVRLIEYAPYAEIRRLLPPEQFLREWPRIASRVRSRARREGMEFLYQRLHQNAAGHG